MATISPNKIKETLSVEPDTIRIADFRLGTSSTGAYGPTSVTGFYQGISPVTSGYTIYESKPTQGPSVHTPQDDAGLLWYANYLGSAASDTQSALLYFRQQNDKVCLNIDYPDIVTNGLSSLHDFGFTPSYPRIGSTIYDVGELGSQNGSITSYDFGSIILSGDNGESTYMNFSSAYTNYYTFQAGVNSGVTVCMLVNTQGFDILLNYPFQAISSDYQVRAFISKYLTFIEYDSGNGVDQIMEVGPFPENRWVFITTSFDPQTGEMKVYTDGFFREGMTTTNTVSFGNNYFDFTVGAFNTPNTFATSNHTDIMVAMTYNKVLSVDEVVRNFNAYVSRYQVLVNGELITLPEIDYTMDGIRVNLDASDRRSYYEGRRWADLAGPYIDITESLTDSTLFDMFLGSSIYRFFWFSTNNGIYTSNRVTSTTTSSQPSYSLGSFTVEVWVKVISLDGDKPSIFCEIDDSGNQSFAIFIDPVDNYIKAQTVFNGTPFVLDSQVDFTTGSPWKQVIYMFENSNQTLSLYVDGLSKAKAETGISLTSSLLGYQIGGSFDSGVTPFTEGTEMSLSVIRIYDRALTEQEIARNYNAVSPRF